MKRILLLLTICAAMTSGCSLIAPLGSAFVKLAPDRSIYEIASMVTGCPVDIIKGFCFAESSMGANVNHPDPHDVGWFGLHERESFHKERARRYGEYNAELPIDSAIIAGRLYVANLAALGCKEDAIAAHKQGRNGVKRDGRAQWYVNRVLNRI